MSPAEKTRLIAKLQGELLRETRSGHPDWYAEMLVAAAFDGQLMPTNNKYFDLKCELYGRVQVKERVDGTDTTQNRTNFGRYKSGDFDHAAIVVFSSSYRILGASMIPCTDVLSLVRPAGHVKWDDIRMHPNASSIHAELVAVSEEEI
jgi:hypothetical protein